MCYAIPGKIIDINGKTITVDYFGEKRKARNEFFELKLDEYIYAQGGIIVQQITAEEAIPILKTWEELFFKLKETDLRLAREPKTLHQIANNTRQKHLGNSCCIHGIIEFSNFCENDCLYCGIRKSNNKIKRYRMEIDEIISTCEYAVNKLGFKALVFQSGEDLYYDDEKLIELIRKIRKRFGILIILSLGERSFETYRKLYEEGARGVLLRFETSSEKLYKTLKPGYNLQSRIDLIKKLNNIGYLIMTGFLIGLPEQTEKDIINDINLTGSLNAEMFSFGPFIPHKDTPLSNCKLPDLESILNTIARTRILYPEAKVLVTTAVETINKKDGAKLGLMAGGNSLMISLTPEKYRNLYDIYPNRISLGQNVESRIKEVLDLLCSIGRAPTDLGL